MREGNTFPDFCGPHRTYAHPPPTALTQFLLLTILLGSAALTEHVQSCRPSEHVQHTCINRAHAGSGTVFILRASEEWRDRQTKERELASRMDNNHMETEFNKDIEFMISHKPNIFWQVTWRVIFPLIMIFISIFYFVTQISKSLSYFVWDQDTESFPNLEGHPYPSWIFIITSSLGGIPCLSIPGRALFKYFFRRRGFIVVSVLCVCSSREWKEQGWPSLCLQKPSSK